MNYKKIKVPTNGAKIHVTDNAQLQTPDNPIIGFIEGDGIGQDITPAMLKTVDAAVEAAYQGRRKIAWMELFVGEKAVQVYGQDNYLPAETLQALREFKIAIKGPLTTPVGEGFRSLNVALRQQLDLYVCLRPVRYFAGTPSPLKQPEKTDMVIFRENSEDIYAGIEWQADSKEAKQVIDFLQNTMGVTQICHPQQCGIGIKPVSYAGSARLIQQAIQYALDNQRSSVTLVHKGNIMKFTEGAFKSWGYQIAEQQFAATPLDGGPWRQIKRDNLPPLIIKDVIADAFLQQILLRPEEYDVIATLNLNGDYISDALAAQVGGIGIAPGANLGHGLAVFEATHGTAPKYAGQNKVNPGSIILSAEMLLRHIGWVEAADKIILAMEKTISAKQVTYDFARLMPDAKLLSCSEFADALVANF